MDGRDYEEGEGIDYPPPGFRILNVGSPQEFLRGLLAMPELPDDPYRSLGSPVYPQDSSSMDDKDVALLEAQRKNGQLKNAVLLARDKLTEQREILAQLTAMPAIYAPVVSVGNALQPLEDIVKGSKVTVDGHRTAKVVQVFDADDVYHVRFDDNKEEQYADPSRIKLIRESRGFVVVSLEGKLTEVEAPSHLSIGVGDVVKLNAKTMQIVDTADMDMCGEVATVSRLLDDQQVEVSVTGGVRTVFIGRTTSLELGDRVILDPGMIIVMQNLGKDEERFAYDEVTHLTWNDIGGLEQEKREMVEAIEAPHRHKDLYRFYGKKPVKGVLLYGPPGCGKTMLGKASATSLAQIYGHQTSSGFMYVKGPEILDKYVGVAEATVRQLFERARRHYRKEGYPAVIFIDEADAILGKRGSGKSSDMERTIVPMFLTEMDGLEDSDAVVILATNRPDTLDPAIVRDGRIDRKIKIGRPSQADAIDIFKLYLSGVPQSGGNMLDSLAERASAALFSPEYVLQTVMTNEGTTPRALTLAHIVNGGMVAGIVDKATSFAMGRAIATGKRDGITCQDLIDAVGSTLRQNRDLDHTDDIVEFLRAPHPVGVASKTEGDVHNGQYL